MLLAIQLQHVIAYEFVSDFIDEFRSNDMLKLNVLLLAESNSKAAISE